MRVVLMYSLQPPSQAHIERLKGLAHGLEVIVAGCKAEACKAAVDAEVILGHRYLRQCLPSARRLRWVQSSAGSIDRLPLAALAERGIILSRSTIDFDEVAAHAVALAWSLTRALPEARDNQLQKRWNTNLNFGPTPRKALVLGVGPVGLSIARRLRAQHISVDCAKRSPPQQGVSELPCDRLLAGGQWRAALPEVDWCLLALTHTPETSGLFDEAALRTLRADAVLVNVGRGETLDTDALIRVLNEGHLTGAALDVVHPSPLPPAHELWRTPRVFITPHVGSHQPARVARLERYFEDQLARYLAGEPLRDQIDLSAATTW